MSNQFGDTRIDDDLTLLSETLEEVLRSSGVITIGRSRLFIVLMTTSTKNPGKELVWARPLGWY